MTQARRLLAAIGRPAASATIETTPSGPTAIVDSGRGGKPEDSDAILDWAFEAGQRVLRGDPQPSDAEVYKAARLVAGQPGD